MEHLLNWALKAQNCLSKETTQKNPVENLWGVTSYPPCTSMCACRWMPSRCSYAGKASCLHDHLLSFFVAFPKPYRVTCSELVSEKSRQDKSLEIKVNSPGHDYLHLLLPDLDSGVLASSKSVQEWDGSLDVHTTWTRRSATCLLIHTQFDSKIFKISLVLVLLRAQ